MIDINREQPDEQLPENFRAVGTNDTRMIERAIRNGWNVPAKYRKAIVNRQVRIATSKESSPREATSAARCLVSMSAEDNAVSMKLLDKLIPDQKDTDSRAEQLRAAFEQVRTDENYGRVRRAKLLGYSGEPRTNGNGSKSGPLDDGPASRAG